MTWARTSSGSNRLMVEIDVLAVYRGFLTMGIGASPLFPDPRDPQSPPAGGQISRVGRRQMRLSGAADSGR